MREHLGHESTALYRSPASLMRAHPPSTTRAITRQRMNALRIGRLTRRFPCAGAAVFLRRYRDERRASTSRSSHKVLRLKTADDFHIGRSEL